jgi:hypothetical protein
MSHITYPAIPSPKEVKDMTPPQSPLQNPGLARVFNGRVFLTNLVRVGLRSVDRNNKATLLLTRPSGTIKSYAKDLSPRMVKLQDVS